MAVAEPRRISRSLLEPEGLSREEAGWAVLPSGRRGTTLHFLPTALHARGSVRTAKAILAAAPGRKGVSPQATIGFEHGASDARHLAAHGIPGIVWGADGDESQHSADEHVDIQSVLNLSELLKKFISKLHDK